MEASTPDKIIVTLAGIVVLVLFISGVIFAFRKSTVGAGLSFFFSLLYANIIRKDFSFHILGKNIYNNRYGDAFWYVSHLTRMQLSFVTAIGAFTAVQNIFGNTLLNFILPAVIAIPIVRKSKEYLVRKAGI